LYGYVTSSPTVKERVVKNRVLRSIFRLKREKWWQAGEECVWRSFITCTLHQMLLW
jgi:hypothetical protein